MMEQHYDSRGFREFLRPFLYSTCVAVLVSAAVFLVVWAAAAVVEATDSALGADTRPAWYALAMGMLLVLLRFLSDPEPRTARKSGFVANPGVGLERADRDLVPGRRRLVFVDEPHGRVSTEPPGI